MFGAGYSVSTFTDWHSGEASVWVKRRVDHPVLKWSAGRPAQHTVHPVPGMSPDLCTEQLGVVGPWHERLAHFRPTPTLAQERSCNQRSSCHGMSHNGPPPSFARSVASLRRLARQRGAYGPRR